MKKIIILDKDLSKLTDPQARLRTISVEDGLIVTSSPSELNSEEFAVTVARYATDFQSRNQGLIDESRLQDEHVTIVGCGSGGSMIADHLIRNGVLKLTLIDYDKVEVSNLCRSTFNLADVDMSKVEALPRHLHRINPQVKLTLINRNILEMEYAELEALVGSTSLIIEATDDVKTKVLVNGVAYGKVPVLYPAVYDGGRGGEILFTIPSVTPCYECVMSSILPQMEEANRGDWDYTSGGTKPMAGLSADIAVVVARTVKLALAFLLEGTDKGFLEKMTVPGCSILFIGNEQGFFIFDEPFQEVWGETEVDPECTCQETRYEVASDAAGPESADDGSQESAHDEPARPAVLSEPEEGAGAVEHHD